MISAILFSSLFPSCQHRTIRSSRQRTVRKIYEFLPKQFLHYSTLSMRFPSCFLSLSLKLTHVEFRLKQFTWIYPIEPPPLYTSRSSLCHFAQYTRNSSSFTRIDATGEDALQLPLCTERYNAFRCPLRGIYLVFNYMPRRNDRFWQALRGICKH